MVVKKEIQDKIGKSAGDRVRVSMELDEAHREVVIPEDVLQALRRDRNANAFFESLSYRTRRRISNGLRARRRMRRERREPRR